MSTNVKLSKFQLDKIVQLGGFLDKTLGSQGKEVLLDLAVPLAR